MKCPKCGSSKTRVIDSRAYQFDKIRLRACPECGKTWHTLERIVDDDAGRLMRSRAINEAKK